MFAIYGTKQKAQETINKINSDYKGSDWWSEEAISDYGSVIELQNGNFAIQVLNGYEDYFEAQLTEAIEVKKVTTLI